MGLGDKIENAVQDLSGKAKEKVGDAADDDRLKGEGRLDQAKADLKDAADSIKDAFKKD